MVEEASMLDHWVYGFTSISLARRVDDAKNLSRRD